MPGPTAVAVDWSGAVAGSRRKIWLAAAVPGRLTRLEDGRDRPALEQHLLALAEADPAVVVGLDFSFSLPEWFLREHRLADAPALWEAAAREGEAWLAGPVAPFWGRKGARRPAMPEAFRRTEREVAERWRVRPSSTFQVGGAGSVGTGSLRGMPMLARLRAAGFAVWPWDAPRPPVLFEIYPRLMTGPVVKRDPSARARALAGRPEVGNAFRATAIGSEDAFDAALSAVGMAACLDRMLALPPALDPLTLAEGCIWEPPLLS